MKSFIKWILIILVVMTIGTYIYEYYNKSNISTKKISSDSIDQSERTPLADDNNQKVNTEVENETFIKFIPIQELELPNDNTFVTHLAYTLSYNEEFEQADWVAYVLSCSETQGDIKRSNKFKVDEDIVSGSAENSDYSKSGYDRGHLMPAADNSWNKTAMEQSFYYSNMSPQKPSFNRGIWKQLEEQVRDWACQFDSIYVVTGPIFSQNMLTIGTNKVAVPKYYYKAILYYTNSKIESIAFVLPNESSNKELFTFAVSIDSLEKLIKFDLFYKLNDKLESSIESRYNLNFWFNNVN